MGVRRSSGGDSEEGLDGTISVRGRLGVESKERNINGVRFVR